MLLGVTWLEWILLILLLVFIVLCSFLVGAVLADILEYYAKPRRDNRQRQFQLETNALIVYRNYQAIINLDENCLGQKTFEEALYRYAAVLLRELPDKVHALKLNGMVVYRQGGTECWDLRRVLEHTEYLRSAGLLKL